MTAKGNSHITSRIRGYQMCSVCSSSAVPFVTVVSCRREKKHRDLFPSHSATIPHKTNPSSRCVWQMSPDSHREQALLQMKWHHDHLPQEPTPHFTLCSKLGKHPDFQTERSVRNSLPTPMENNSAAPQNHKLQCLLFSSWGHSLSELTRGSLGRWEGSGGRYSKALLENLELWGKLLCHLGLLDSFFQQAGY